MKKLFFAAIAAAMLLIPLPAMAEGTYIELPGTGYALEIPEGYYIATPDYIPEDSPMLSYHDMTPREYRRYLREYDTLLEAFSHDMEHELSLTYFETAGHVDFDSMDEEELRYYYEDDLEYYEDDPDCTVIALGPVDTGDVTVIKQIIGYGDDFVSADYDAAVGDIWFMLFSYSYREGGYPEEYDEACMGLLASLTPLDEVEGRLIAAEAGDGFFDGIGSGIRGGSFSTMGLGTKGFTLLVAMLLLVLGIVVLIIAVGVASRHKRAAAEKKAQEAEHAEISPEPSEPEAEVPHGFGSMELELQQIEASTRDLPEPPNFCRHCGGRLQGGAFCPVCGRPIEF